jgi:hypothetical protein
MDDGWHGGSWRSGRPPKAKTTMPQVPVLASSQYVGLTNGSAAPSLHTPSAEDDAAIARFIRERGVTRCPAPGCGAEVLAAARPTMDQLDFPSKMQPIIQGIIRQGADTPCKIASALNKRGLRTHRGASWQAKTVERLMARLALR